MSIVNFPSVNTRFIANASNSVLKQHTLKLDKLTLPVSEEVKKIRATARQFRNVFEATSHGLDFVPKSSDFAPTQAMPGSAEKIEVLAARIKAGLPLWHEEDRIYISTDLS